MLVEIFAELLKWLGYYVLAILFLSYIFRRFKDFGEVHSRWQHTFDGVQYSSQEFYELITEAIKRRKIPDVSIERVTKSQTRYFLSKREYLEVVRGDQKFLICAAPFADSFFVSWWFGNVVDYLQDFISRIPNVGQRLAQVLFARTYYQMDTDSMFAGIVKDAVGEAIDQLTNAKGIRPLTEAERRPQYIGNPYIG